MKQKIKEALQQAYKNLGLDDEAFERVAAFGETLGINEESMANFVKGANDTLKKMQSDADKMRNARSESSKQVEELKAQIAALEAKPKDGEDKKTVEPVDYAKIISEEVSKALKPLQDELAGIKATRSAEDAFNSAKEVFFANEYAKKFTNERDDAWERAVELNDATGKKMTAEELKTKALGYFNTLVSRKGVDISKPFKSEGSPDDTPDFSDEKEYLQKEGLIK